MDALREIAQREGRPSVMRCTFVGQRCVLLRINQQTATLDCEGQTWRVAFGLLHHVIEV